jgi:hypothetical protein
MTLDRWPLTAETIYVSSFLQRSTAGGQDVKKQIQQLILGRIENVSASEE